MLEMGFCFWLEEIFLFTSYTLLVEVLFTLRHARSVAIPPFSRFSPMSSVLTSSRSRRSLESDLYRLITSELRSSFYHPSKQQALTSLLPSPDRELRRLLQDVQRTWIALLNLNTSLLHQLKNHFHIRSEMYSHSSWSIARPSWARFEGFEAAESSLSTELLRRPWPLSITPRDDHHLRQIRAGIFINYLLPFPSLLHLAYPFRSDAFVLSLCRDIWSTPLPSPDYVKPSCLDTPTVDAFESALSRLVVYIKERRSGNYWNRKSAISAILDAATACHTAERATERLLEGILDAILVWKARKNDDERESRECEA